MDNVDKPSSRNIPDPIQRIVRKRCGFGCVICGIPLYDYDHMEGWAKVYRHVASEITLLCRMHHNEKTYGLLPLKDVIAANDAPFNLRQGVSKPYDLHFSGKDVEVIMGGNRFLLEIKKDPQGFISILVDQNILLGFFI